ncbi:hypothetical protein [Dyella japonica]|uniref:Outer membrane protein beta-barrel domain-containing protein n=1 Tax=Dyella japonica TaxID=231455 RepID=A0ABV2JNX6_9GAMM
MRRNSRMYLALALPLALTFQTVRADDHPMLDYLSVSIGGFANNNSASMRADGHVKNSGTRLDFSRDLGQGGTRTLPYLSVTWRPWDRHEFEFTYYHDSTDSTRYLNRTLQFNGNQLDVGAQLHSRFTLDAGSVGYRYWAWIGERGAFGVSGGLQFYRFSLKLSGNAFAANGSGSATASGSRTARVSSNLPDPSIGVSYRYQAASWVRIVADAGAFKANINQIDARLYNARVGAEFYPWEHFGITTQYAFNKIDADVNKSNFNGNVNFRFKGFQLLVRARF